MIDEAGESLVMAKGRMDVLKSKTNQRWQKYILPSEIEYVETCTYFLILKESRIPSKEELNVELEPYLLGLLDCIGELRRAVYDKINEQNYGKSAFFFDSMRTIFENLSPFSYFDNAVPSLRRKVDLARRLIEETYVDLTKINALRG